jgi:hypothetical protein
MRGQHGPQALLLVPRQVHEAANHSMAARAAAVAVERPLHRCFRRVVVEREFLARLNGAERDDVQPDYAGVRLAAVIQEPPREARHLLIDSGGGIGFDMNARANLKCPARRLRRARAIHVTDKGTLSERLIRDKAVMPIAMDHTD